MKPKAQLELFNLNSDKELAQHNHLITGQYEMSVLETRLFVSMLARINRDDKNFDWIQIPVKEIISNTTGEDYEALKKACNRLTGFKINAKKFDKDGFDFIVVIARCIHRRGAGHIYAKFFEDAKPYLLQLAGNFTTAQLGQLLQFRNPHSSRIYWLLKSLYLTNEYKTSFLELKLMLLGKDEGVKKYERYKDFRKRILIPVQEELNFSDCAFDLIEERVGKSVTHIIFKLKPKKNIFSISLPEDIQQALIKCGVSIKSLPEIDKLFLSNVIDVKYIDYVITQKTNDYKKGKIKRLGGAIFKAIIDKQLFFEYQNQKKNPKINKIQSSIKQDENKIEITLEKAQLMFEVARKNGKTKALRFETYLKAILQNGYIVK